MEKSVAASSKKVSNHIPNDIAFSILSKLPLKSLKRFGGVLKSWGLLFENPYFINIYHKHFESRSREPLLFEIDGNPSTENCYSAHLLSGDKFENKTELNLPPPLQELELKSMWLVGSGSINGTLCFSSYFNERRAYENRVVLWNPDSEEFKVIPPSPLESIPNGKTQILVHGFGYDHLKNDFKVIRSVNFEEVTFDGIEFIDYSAKDLPWDPFWEVYSLKSNSWMKINVDMRIPPCLMLPCDNSQVYMDGMCHWWQSFYDGKTYLLSFDLHNEVFFTTPFPSYLHDFGPVSIRLEVLNGSVALIAYNYFTYYLHVSIMGEVGLEESWTKLFLIGPFSEVGYPIGIVKNGNIIFQQSDGVLVLFDKSTQTMEELGVKADNCWEITIYRESIIPIGK